MKITVFRQEEGKKFQINFEDTTANKQGYGFGISLDVEDVRTLNEMLTKELQEMGKPKEQVVWNPRSQRHEKVIKK